jgi:predicted Zn-dependent protease
VIAGITRGYVMNILRRSRVALVFGLLLVVAGCGTVPITGRQQFTLLSEKSMSTMGVQAYGEFLGENKVVAKGEQAAMVKRTGKRIQKAVEEYSKRHKLSLKGYTWEFNLVEGEAKNAWAMPGGKVVVYTGLLSVAPDEACLAVVMGHEIAHVIAKHGNERMSHGLVVQMGGVALSQAVSKQPEATREIFMQSYGAGAKYGVMLPYSRTHESEADHMGLVFMAMAGYDPQAAVGFWEGMSAAKDGGSPPEILSTHPSDRTRIAKIKELLPEVMKYYKVE